jgi:hypothetical protein
MTESPTSGRDTSGDPPPIQRVRTEEPQAPVGQDEPNPNVVSDATADEKSPGEPVDPGVGGYAGRDPKTEMPRMPSIPETQDDKPA